MSIFGNVRKATRFPQYVVAKTKTTNHHAPITILALSAFGRSIPPKRQLAEALTLNNMILGRYNCKEYRNNKTHLVAIKLRTYTKCSFVPNTDHLSLEYLGIHKQGYNDVYNIKLDQS